MVSKAVAEAKAEWCRGQTPQPFSPADYDAQSDWAKLYVTGNMNQWRNAGCDFNREN